MAGWSAPYAPNSRSTSLNPARQSGRRIPKARSSDVPSIREFSGRFAGVG